MSTPRERPLHTHPGPCYVGLGEFFAPNREHTGRALLKAAYWWAEGLEEFTDQIPLVEEVLAKTLPVDDPMNPATRAVEVTPEQQRAVTILLDEAGTYWDMCRYADEDDDDRWLGQVGVSASVISECGFYSPEANKFLSAQQDAAEEAKRVASLERVRLRRDERGGY